MIGTEKPSLEALAHHGVKGMHWGQRSVQSLVPSATQVKTAAVATRKGVAATGKAVYKAGSYAAHHKHMLVGALIAAQLLHAAVAGGNTAILMKAASNREAARKGAELASRMLSSSAGKVNYAKMAKGAYKITSL